MSSLEAPTTPPPEQDVSAPDVVLPADQADQLSLNQDRHNHKFSRWQRFHLRLERRIARMSTRSNFWHRVLSWKYLPLAFRSGIKIHKGSPGTSFAAFLPFRKFNQNWYKAMAGGALLGNAEVAGGMYLLKILGADWTIVCKHLEYDFLRPCLGPAVYKIEPRENIQDFVDAGKEFNITIDMLVVQMVQPKMERERRVGKCSADFHITPRKQYLARESRKS